MLFLLLVTFLVLMCYLQVKKRQRFWERKNVYTEKPTFFVGHLGPHLLRKKSFTELIHDWYKNNPGKRYVGIYQFWMPTLIVRDPELVREIVVKNFDTFIDHRQFTTPEIDPLWANTLVALKGGARWKEMRSTVSPAFTSGKIKLMFPLVKECATQFTDFFLKKSNGKTVSLDIRDATTRFTNDVISTTAFGTPCNSLENPENEFYLMGKELVNFTGLRGLKFFIFSISPLILKYFRITIFSKLATKFFRKIVKETLRVREENNIVRPDMIHLLMEARKGQLKYEETENAGDSGFAVAEESEYGRMEFRNKPAITEEDILSQVMVFFLGGFDTVSVLTTFTSFELALNPDIQAKLRTEIDSTLEQYNGELSYTSIMSMKYLDMVISETLRKWPAAPAVDRVPIRPYTIEPKLPGETALTLEAESDVWIANIGFHRDPQYYPDPEKFDPERFNAENRKNIKPYTYLPFGTGPRSCVAARFALIEGKLFIAQLLSKFEIIPIDKTEIPMRLKPTGFSIKPRDKVWLGLKPRVDNS